MLTRIQIKDAFGVVSSDLDLRSDTTLTGAQGTGKTSHLAAVAAAVWERNLDGSPLKGIVRDGARKAVVQLTTAKGVGLTFTSTASGSRTRTLEMPDGTEHRVTSGAEWQKTLGPVGTDAARNIVVPYVGLDLAAQGPAGVRKLTDLVVDCTPVVDSEAVLLELVPGLSKHDPRDVKAAKADRRDANRTRDNVAGQVQQAERALAQAQAEAAEQVPDVSAQRTVVAFDAAWGDYDSDLGDYNAFLTAGSNAESWDADLTALGECPPARDLSEINAAVDDALAHESQHRAAVAAAEAALSGITDDVSHIGAEDIADATRLRNHADTEAGNALVASDQAQAALSSIETDCPTCGQTLPSEALDKVRAAAQQRAADAAARLARAEATAEAAAADLEQVQGEVEARRAAELEARAELRKTAAAELDEARRALAKAEAVTREARAARDAANSEPDPAATWREKRAALGNRPEVPDAVERPAEPQGTRPTVEQVHQARRDIAAAERLASVIDDRKARAAGKAGELAALKKRATETREHAEFLDELVQALVRLPAEVLRRSVAALGDLGPLTIDVDGDGNVQVLYDGRPWALSTSVSRGERIVADFRFRAALATAYERRHRLTTGTLGLWVDDAQSATEPLPEVPRQVVRLVTVAGQSGLSVETGRAARAVA